MEAIHVDEHKRESNFKIASAMSAGETISKLQDANLFPAEYLNFDSYGIPVIDYRTMNGVYIGKQRNPVTTSQKSWNWLKLYQQTKDVIYYNYFFNCAQWLMEWSEKTSNGLMLPYRFPYPPYNLVPNWYSAMAQGQAIQTLTYAYRISQNKIYLDYAKEMLKPLKIEIKNGGVGIKLNENAWWYEEYASSAIKPPMVLNGMNFCLLGIYEYYKTTGDPEAKEVFDRGINGLLLELHKYDCDGWTYYDQLGHISSSHYHSIHVNQMKQLHDITGNEKFLYYYERWKEKLQ